MPALLLILFFLTSCHTFEKEKKEVSAKIYFDKAIHYKNKKNYRKALENLNQLKKHFFYSKYDQKALLLIADIYFAQEKYSQAALSYKKHFKLYPKMQKNYVLYQMGISYKNQLPKRVDYDLSLAAPALKAFDSLLNLKKPSPYKEKVKIEKQNILDKQASKELKTALFYKKQGWKQASLHRIQFFIKNYPKSPLMPTALLTGFELAHLLDKNPKKFKENLIKKYPDSKEAKSILKIKKNSSFSKWKQKIL